VSAPETTHAFGVTKLPFLSVPPMYCMNRHASALCALAEFIAYRRAKPAVLCSAGVGASFVTPNTFDLVLSFAHCGPAKKLVVSIVA